MAIDSDISIKYATKVWLTGVFGGTTLLLLYFSRGLGFLLNAEGIRFIVIMLVYGLIFSVPSWILLWLSVAWSNRLSWSVLSIKGLLLGIATLLSIIPFNLFFGFLGEDDLLLVLPAINHFWHFLL